VAGSGGKGKISNDLVAVSCAAVLTVYAAGYWRTREAARRLDSQSQERRPSPTELAATPPGKTAPSEAPPALPPSPESSAPITPSMAVAVAAPTTGAMAAEVSSKVAAATLPPAVDSLQAATLPETSVAVVAVTSVIEPVPVSLVTAESQPIPAGNWRDGTFTGWGSSRHGDIKAQVLIRNGRIVESGVASCETRWPCDVISTIINQPVERQNADVDRVSRATESTNAYYYALVDALDDALVDPPVQTTTPR
jgi:uncharacterized protein with FMN-binding domain